MVFVTSAPCPESKIVGAPRIRRCARVYCRVNMSEEQYDCQVTSEHYADYFLRSKISWARLVGDAAQAAQLPEQMREHVQSTRTNCQYFEMEEIAIQKPPPQQSAEMVISRRKGPSDNERTA